MASIRRKQGTANWFACFRDADGKRRQQSTGTSDRKEAQRIADEYEAAARQQKTEAQVRKVFSEIVERNTGAPMCSFTLKTWLARWLERVKPEVSKGAHDRYSNAVDSICSMGGSLCEKRLDRIVTDDVETLRDRLHAVRSAATTNFALKVLRMALKRAGSLLPHNPAVGVKPVKKTEAEIRENGEGKQPFTSEQLRLLMSKADDEWKGMIRAGIYSAGQRLVDVARLRVNQVDLDGGVVRFCTEKTERSTIIPILPQWRADLVKRMKGLGLDAPIFPRAFEKVKLANGKSTDVSKSFRRLLCECGLAPKVGPRKGSSAGRRRPLPYSFASFRHTASTFLVNAGVSDRITRDLVGHESLAVSRRYTHIDVATKAAAMERGMRGVKIG